MKGLAEALVQSNGSQVPWLCSMVIPGDSFGDGCLEEDATANGHRCCYLLCM